jgi:hypothetical protein
MPLAASDIIQWALIWQIINNHAPSDKTDYVIRCMGLARAGRLLGFAALKRNLRNPAYAATITPTYAAIYHLVFHYHTPGNKI